MTGPLVLTLITVALAMLLLLGDRVFADQGDAAVERIERVLPRIQCGQCGYAGCRPYAQALVDGSAPINLCPPGGMATVHQLAELLGEEPQQIPRELGHASLDHIATIDEALCIGCNLCSRACPVDAILGLPQLMHTVIASECTGCERCLTPCPVDCIQMTPRHA